jgi:hypothetical protein
MININGVKFARNASELTDTLFDSGGTQPTRIFLAAVSWSPGSKCADFEVETDCKRCRVSKTAV